jgi:putative chitinase
LTGRFTQADDIQAGQSAQGRNRFSYVLNNPLRLIDPTGHQATGVADAGVTPSGGSTLSPPQLTVSQVRAIVPLASDRSVNDFVRVVNDQAANFGLNLADPVAVSHFLSQVAAEGSPSDPLAPSSENLNYSDAGRIQQIFPSRFKPDSGYNAADFVHNPVALGNLVYGGRPDAGDGYLYRGRTNVQLTKKENYVRLQRDIDAGRFGSFDGGIDVLANPDLLLQPELSAMTALWYFQTRVLNHFDAGFSSDGGDVRAVTRLVNGPAAAGINLRNQYFQQSKRILDVPLSEPKQKYGREEVLENGP